MKIYASVAKDLWPNLIEFATTKGKVNTVTTHDEAVQGDGYLFFVPVSVQFSDRGNMKVPDRLRTYRQINVLHC